MTGGIGVDSGLGQTARVKMEQSDIMFMVMLAAGVMLYFLPLLVANSRGRDGQVWIGLSNLLFGWTVIGWFVLLIIAFTGEGKKDREHREKMIQLLADREKQT